MQRTGKLLIVLAIVILAGIILGVPWLKGWVKAATDKKLHSVVIPADRLSARRHVVLSLHSALEQGDFKQAALLNSILGQEAFQRAYRVLKAWEKSRDPESGLVPRTVGNKQPYWIPRDTAADLFPFLLLASQYLDKDSEPLWLTTLANERKICGPMPCEIRLQPTKVIKQSRDDVIFGASEVCKDGLMPLLERSGRGPWFERLEEIAQLLMKTASVETKSGKIVASDNEVNGNMLIVLSRLYWATKKAEYLHMAERIAEAYLFEIFPNNHYLPPHEWNFTRSKPASSFFRLRDHGNEIIQGLSELYFLEKMNGRPQAARYREPLKKFLDLLLVVGRTPDGLWYGDVDSKTGKTLDNKSAIDTWGYIVNAYQMFDLAEGTSLYAGEIKRAMRAAAARKSYWREYDAYADAIESMLYLLPWFDIPECHYWVDDEIEVLFHMQSPSGFVKHYLDGNFIRTALLYATYKTQGALVQPWREDVYLGAAFDKVNKELYLCLRTNAPWQGLLRFDQDRHRIILNLPFEYPRLNETPEWFVVEPHKTYSVVNLHTGKETSYAGASLAQGLPVTMEEKEYSLWLKVSEK